MNLVEPRFLTREQITRLHELGLARFGGAGGVRDSGLVDSAIAAAKNAFFYGHGDVFDVAAAYAYHLAEAQAFLDGNKRTAVGAALVFLELNGVRSFPNDDLLYGAMIALATKQLSKTDLAAMFRSAAAAA
jgi:death-on-curing protein